MNNKKLIIFFEIFIFFFVIHFISIHIGLGTEEFLKKAILVGLTVFYLDLFGFYEQRGMPKNDLFFSIFMVIFFTLLSSLIVTYLIYFRVLGRKVYIAYFLFLSAYLYIKNFISLKYPIKSKIYAANCEKLFNTLNITDFVVFDINCNPDKNDIIVVNEEELDDEIALKLLKLKLTGITVVPFTKFYEKLYNKIPVDLFHNISSLIVLDGFNKVKTRTEQGIKRLADFTIASVFLILFSPFFLIVAIAIKLDSKGPVFFKQKRTGEQGKPFTIYKFRSMITDAEKLGAKWASEDDPRITRVGKFIRKTRIDELPQLINILKGDMSFVGPRPERPEFDEILSNEIPYWMLRYIIKPGLTGWAQINYDYGASVEDAKEKLKYDLYYIKNFSLYLDLKVIFKTLKVVFFGKGR